MPQEGMVAGDPHARLLTELEGEALPDVPSAKSTSTPATPDEDEIFPPTTAYVSKRGRHRQLINSSVLDKVMQQRRQAIESSQHRKALVNDQGERQRMRHYLEGLHGSQGSSNAQVSQKSSSMVRCIEIDGLSFEILKDGSKLARKYG
ncbi:MAG: hypothetical protein Q9196_001322 [Gyalolechia fulgens]